MGKQEIMCGFPPPAEHQVTLANWREPGFNGWAFHHVREILPTANVSRGDGAVRELSYRPIDCDAVAFEDSQGDETTVGQFFADSATDGVVVLHEGRVIFERYANGMTPETPHILFSVTKSVARVADRHRRRPGPPRPGRPSHRLCPRDRGLGLRRRHGAPPLGHDGRHPVRRGLRGT